MNKHETNTYFFFSTDHRTCHAGIGRGDGWIIPLNIYIETQQFIPQQCTIFENIGKFSFLTLQQHLEFDQLHYDWSGPNCL